MVRGIWQRDYDLNSAIRGATALVATNDVPSAFLGGRNTGGLLGNAAADELWGSCLQSNLSQGGWGIAAAAALGNGFYRPEYTRAGQVRAPIAINRGLNITTDQLIVLSFLDERRSTTPTGPGIVTGMATAANYNPDRLTTRRIDTENNSTGDAAKTIDWYDTTASVWVAADLTDNVNVYVSFLNERNWDVMNAAREEVMLDKANLTLAEMYGYPFTMCIGRQDITFGEGFLISDGLRFGMNPGFAYNQDVEDYPYGSISAFDALRFTWNSDPHQVDLVLAKINEQYHEQVALAGDEDLYALNWNYEAGVYGIWDFGLYWTHQDVQSLSVVNANVDPNIAAGTTNVYGTNDNGGTYMQRVTAENAVCRRAPNGLVNGKIYSGNNHTNALSVRAEADAPWVTVGTLAMKGEVVSQWGTVATAPYALIQDPNNPTDLLIEGKQRGRRAWGYYADVEYTFESPYRPYLGMGYTHLSGDKSNSASVLENSGTIETFDPMFEGKKYGEIADWVYGNMTNNRPWAGQDDFGVTNANIFKVGIGFNPTENLLVDLTYFGLRQDQAEYNILRQKNGNRAIGTEYDLTLAYDYTEDVSFGLIYAVFNPGGYWEDALLTSDFDDQAREFLGSVKVSF